MCECDGIDTRGDVGREAGPLLAIDGPMMDLPPETIDDLKKRLRRAQGQVQGVVQMLDDGRDCRDVLTQLSAATKALEQAGFLLVAAGLTWCLSDPERAESEGFAIEQVQKMFMKLA